MSKSTASDNPGGSSPTSPPSRRSILGWIPASLLGGWWSLRRAPGRSMPAIAPVAAPELNLRCNADSFVYSYNADLLPPESACSIWISNTTYADDGQVIRNDDQPRLRV